MKAFLARDCFVGRVGFTPEFLLSSRRVNREVMSIVEISVTYAPKQTVFYMLTHRAVLGGLKI
jgi:hypothetical protein